MKTIKGDLLTLAQNGHFDVIVHGCNCFHTMGAGIAKTIAMKYPQALLADKATAKGQKDKLGNISTADIVDSGSEFTIVNAYTQFHWKGNGRRADYDAIRSCFEKIVHTFPNARIGYPLIGAGLAGGDWNTIAPIIDTELDGLDHTLVIFIP